MKCVPASVLLYFQHIYPLCDLVRTAGVTTSINDIASPEPRDSGECIVAHFQVDCRQLQAITFTWFVLIGCGVGEYRVGRSGKYDQYKIKATSIRLSSDGFQGDSLILEYKSVFITRNKQRFTVR